MPAPYQFLPSILAQANPWDDEKPTPTPPQPQRPMSFSDLQQGLHDYSTGKTNDNGFRNGILVMMALIGLIALVIHLRQRHKNAGPPESIHKLGRELAHTVRFPFASRFLLAWVASSTKTPFASLLLSAALFDKCIKQWSSLPTFSVARRWAKSRLDRLRPVLFA